MSRQVGKLSIHCGCRYGSDLWLACNQQAAKQHETCIGSVKVTRIELAFVCRATRLQENWFQKECRVKKPAEALH